MGILLQWFWAFGMGIPWLLWLKNVPSSRKLPTSNWCSLASIERRRQAYCLLNLDGFPARFCCSFDPEVRSVFFFSFFTRSPMFHASLLNSLLEMPLDCMVFDDISGKGGSFVDFQEAPQSYFCPENVPFVGCEAIEAKENVQIQAESVTLASQLNSVFHSNRQKKSQILNFDHPKNRSVWWLITLIHQLRVLVFF